MSDIQSMTDEQLLAAGLELARRFYKAHGYEVAKGYKFYESQHPQELTMWNLAVIAFEELTQTDLEDVLSSIDEEDSQ